MPKLVGVLADVHGDLQALDAALARLHDMGCDVILCAGDLIDVEPLGEEVIQRLKAEKNITCILGNHERWALESRRRTKDVRRFFEPCNLSDHFGGGAELSRDSLVWLAAANVGWGAPRIHGELLKLGIVISAYSSHRERSVRFIVNGSGRSEATLMVVC